VSYDEYFAATIGREMADNRAKLVRDLLEKLAPELPGEESKS